MKSKLANKHKSALRSRIKNIFNNDKLFNKIINENREQIAQIVVLNLVICALFSSLLSSFTKNPVYASNYQSGEDEYGSYISITNNAEYDNESEYRLYYNTSNEEAIEKTARALENISSFENSDYGYNDYEYTELNSREAAQYIANISSKEQAVALYDLTKVNTATGQTIISNIDFANDVRRYISEHPSNIAETTKPYTDTYLTNKDALVAYVSNMDIKSLNEDETALLSMFYQNHVDSNKNGSIPLDEAQEELLKYINSDGFNMDDYIYIPDFGDKWGQFEWTENLSKDSSPLNNLIAKSDIEFFWNLLTRDDGNKFDWDKVSEEEMALLYSLHKQEMDAALNKAKNGEDLSPWEKDFVAARSVGAVFENLSDDELTELSDAFSVLNYVSQRTEQDMQNERDALGEANYEQKGSEEETALVANTENVVLGNPDGSGEIMAVQEYAVKDMLDGMAFEFARNMYSILDSALDTVQTELVYFSLPGSITLEASQGNNAMNAIAGLWELILSKFLLVGGIIATLIFLFNLFLTFFQKTSELKHTPIQILSRYTITMVFLYGIGNKESLNSILKMFSDIMSNCFMYGHVSGAPYSTGNNTSIAGLGASWSLKDLCLLDVETLIQGNNPDNQMILNALTALTDLPFGIGGWICVFILFLVSLPLIKQVFKLMFEIIERWLVLMFFICVAPLAIGFSVSKNSSSVTISYLKLVFCQTLLLLCNALGLYGFAQILCANHICNTSVIGYIFAITYLIFAQRMDSYLQAMGLSVAHTGGGVLDNVGLAVRNGMAMMRGATRAASKAGHAANQGRKAVGAGLMLAGTAAGSRGLVKAGNFVGMTGRSLMGSMTDGLGSIISDKRAANTIGASGHEVKRAKADNVMGAIADTVHNPISRNQDTLRGYGKENVAQALSSKLEGNPNVSHVNMNQLKNGELGFNATYGQGASAKTADMQISSMPSANSLEMRDSSGKLTGMYLSSQNTLSNDGDTLVRNDAGGITASSMMSLTGVQNLSDTNLGFNYKDVHKVENRNGELGYMDKSGALLGVQNIKTGKFSASYTPQPSGGSGGSSSGGSRKNSGGKHK